MPAPSSWWRRQYDRESKAWDRRSREPFVAATREELVGMLTTAVDVDGPLLDVGCGPGAYARELPGFVVGVDLAPGMLRQAASHGGVALVQADLSRGLPFREGAFAGVLALLVLQHVRDPHAAVDELHRVVREQGCAVLSVPAKEFGPVKRKGMYWRVRAWVARLPGLITWFSEYDVRAVVTGFDIVELRRVGGSHAVLLRDAEAL